MILPLDLSPGKIAYLCSQFWAGLLLAQVVPVNTMFVLFVRVVRCPRRRSSGAAAALVY